jgi:hypothetical protein
MSIKIELTKEEYKDLINYCQLNNIDIDLLSKKCFLEGLRIEKYGLLNSNSKIVEKEVIIEKPVEVIKEVVVEKLVEIIKEVPVEVIKEVETIREVPVEVIKEVVTIKEVPINPVEIEVIKYVDREVIKEVFIENAVTNLDNICDKTYVEELEIKIKSLESRPPEIKEIIKEIPVEIVKEVIVEKEDVTLKTKLESLQQTLMKLKEDNIKKDKEIEENKKLIEDFKRLTEDKKAVFLRGSNLNKLY